ncbi:MAG: ABC transporter substrate-binding protein, partial [Thermomicrobiales bacterium]|nr:ABC transporter substrate-binding protein [Thermomicrobiales bacterium]
CWLLGNMMRFTVFNGLVKYASDLSYVGDLAASWENPDDKTYIFTLKDGLTYHDGSAVEASHVEFSFKRIAEKQTVFSSRVANIAAYEVVDAKTIKLTLTNVQADFLDGLVPLSIISPEIAENIETTAVGTGPFKFVEWTPNDSIVLEKNPTYHEAGVPGVDKLTFKIIPEAQIAITNVQSGTVNAVLNVPVSQAAPLKDSSDVTALIVPTSSFHLFEMIGKNHEAIRNNVAVRQALAHCLDKAAIQATVFNGEGFPKWSFVGSTHWAYKEIAGYAYDPAAAAALLTEAGVTDLEFTCLCIQGYPDGEKAATIWQAGLAEAGIKMNIEVQELSVWLDNYINHTYDVIWNVFPGFADPNYFVGLGRQPHFADGWTNADAARIAEEANQTLDQAERTALYGELQDMTVAELPVMVIQEAPQASLTPPNVTGWEINPLGFVFVDKVTIGE